MFFTLALSALAAGAYATSAHTSVLNELDEPLVLKGQTTNFGTFTTLPPAIIPANGRGNWTNTGSVYQNYGFIEFDVYYTSSGFGTGGDDCVDITYFWDLVVGLCAPTFTQCPTNAERAAANVRAKRAGLLHTTRMLWPSRRRQASSQCYVFIDHSCPAWGDPKFRVYDNCTSSALAN
jgi:hypothetical protein